MYWIEFRKNEPIRDESLGPQSCIPEELKYPDWQTDKTYNNSVPLMEWIKYRQNEPIPKELKYLGWQTDKDNFGNTPLMLWIICRKNESIPEELR